ncbi:MAG: hypothetical protein AAF798_19740 [Bacteroidota bacterium]
MIFKNNLFLLALLLLGATACNPFGDFDDIEQAPYTPEYALSLVDTRFAMSDLLENVEENSTLTVDPDGLIRFKYTGDVISRTSEDVFNSINATLEQFPAIPLLFSPMPLPFSQPEELEIDRLDIKSGDFYINITNNTEEELMVTITVPQATRNGEVLEIVETVAAGDFFNNQDDPISLADYRLIPTGGTVFIEYTSIATASNEEVDPNLIFVGFEGLEFTYAEGYLGNQVYEGGRDTIEIDFFDSWIQGDVYFEDPIITFNFDNSFGIPTRSVVNVFDIFTVREEVLPLESEFISGGIDFPYPDLNEVGALKTRSFVFTKENSNIDEVLGAGPVAIDYDVNALTNPDELVDIRGFITDSSFYRVQVEVELPMYGRATQFVVTDTFDLALGDFDDATFAEFKLVAENELPLSVETQSYFLNDEGVVLDSLLAAPERLIAAAPVDAEGNVIGVERRETFVTFADERLQRLLKATRVLVNATFNTTTDGDQSVRVLNEQGVDVGIGVRVGLENE